MTDRKSRRVVIINNINSDTIDQAIFILKSTKSDQRFRSDDNNVVIEAQKIINNYIKQVERLKSGYSSPPKEKHAGRLFAVIASAVALLSLGVIFFVTGNIIR